LTNGADLDATLSPLANDICEPQDAVTNLTSSFFRVAIRTLDRLTVAYMKGLRDDVRRVTAANDFKLASWDQVAAEGE
jgi:hypothetical protein